MRFSPYTSLFAFMISASVLIAAGQPYAGIVSYDYAQGQGPRHEIKDIIRSTPIEDLPTVEANILATLASPDCTDAGKRFCFQLLRSVGGVDTVNAVSTYLVDATYSDAARYAMEGIAGDDATGAFRDALSSASGKARMGIIMSLGERRDAASLEAIAAFAKDADSDTLAAVLQALGNIGTRDAAKALTALEVTGVAEGKRDNALLICAEHLVAAGDAQGAAKIGHALARSNNRFTRTGVMSVLSKAGSKDAVDVLAGFMKDEDASVAKTAIMHLGACGNSRATALITSSFDALTEDAQLTALAALGMLGDRAAIEVVKRSMASENPDIAKTALVTLGAVGSGDELDIFLDLFAKNDRLGRDIASAISRLKSKDIVDVILAKAAGAEDEAAALLIGSLEARGDASAVPPLLKRLPFGASKAERAAGKVVARLGQAEHVEVILARMIETPECAELLEQPLVFLVKREDVDCSHAIAAKVNTTSGKTKAAMIRICGQVGGAKTLDTLMPLLSSSDADLVDAAVRGLSAYRHDSSIMPLSQVIGTVASDTHRVLLSRSVLSQLPDARMILDDKVNVLATLIEELPSGQDKKNALSQLLEYPCPSALKMAEKWKADPELSADAASIEAKIRRIISTPGLTASHNGATVALAIDGDPKTRWDTRGKQTPGQWFKIELRDASVINSLTLDTSGSQNDYPRLYDVQVSDDDAQWTTVIGDAKGEGAITKITFDPAVHPRFIKISQKGSSPANYWSIHELSFE